MALGPIITNKLAARFTQASIYSIGMVLREEDVFRSEIFRHFKTLTGFGEWRFVTWALSVIEATDEGVDPKLSECIFKESMERFKDIIVQDPKCVINLCRTCKAIQKYVIEKGLKVNSF